MRHEVRGTHILHGEAVRKPGVREIVICECYRCNENIAAFDNKFHDVDDEGNWVDHRHQPEGYLGKWVDSPISHSPLEPKDYHGN